MKKKNKKIDPNSIEWDKLANQTARKFCPEIYPCKHCGNPVIKGICCEYCGSIEPR